jgi:glycosidase
MLTLYKRLLAVRRDKPALSIGELVLLDAPLGVLAYERRHGGTCIRILLNMTPLDVRCEWQGAPLISTLTGTSRNGILRADEGIIVTSS